MLSVYISGKRTQTAMAACDRIWRSLYLQDVSDLVGLRVHRDGCLQQKRLGTL